MSELIDRRAAMDALEQGFKDTTNGIDKLSPTYELIKAMTGIYKCYIGKLHPIKPAEPKRGKWIDLHTKEEIYGEMYRCSVCGDFDFGGCFCPNCGADMRSDDMRKATT